MLGLAHHCAIYSSERQSNRAVQYVMSHMHKKEEMEETATGKKRWRRWIHAVPSGAATTQMKRMFRSNA